MLQFEFYGSPACCGLIFEGKIEVENMISHRFNLEKLMDAVELADKRKLERWEGESGEE